MYQVQRSLSTLARAGLLLVRFCEFDTVLNASCLPSPVENAAYSYYGVVSFRWLEGISYFINVPCCGECEYGVALVFDEAHAIISARVIPLGCELRTRV